MPIVKVGTRGQSKEMRVRSYSMLIQGGLIRFPERGTSNIEQQLTEFPLGAYDDLCDGLWLAIQAAQSGGGGTISGTTLKTMVKSMAKDIIRRGRR